MPRSRGQQSPPPASKKRAVIAAVAVVGVTVVALVAVGVAPLVLPTSPAEHSARADVNTLSSAVADYVAANDRLPRVTVRPGVSAGGHAIWGAEFLVESREVPRADPTSELIFYLVGDAGSWCVEALYVPPTLFSDSSGEWVLAKGEGDNVGKVVDGHCGADYVLELSPVTETDVPEPGSVIAAVNAPVGTCFADPFSAPTQPFWIEVIDCDSAHYGEVFFAGEGSANEIGAYEQAAAGSCATELTSFIGISRNLSAFTAEPVTIDRDAWDGGAREYTCILFLGRDDYPLVGSARDSWR